MITNTVLSEIVNQTLADIRPLVKAGETLFLLLPVFKGQTATVQYDPEGRRMTAGSGDMFGVRAEELMSNAGLTAANTFSSDATYTVQILKPKDIKRERMLAVSDLSIPRWSKFSKFQLLSLVPSSIHTLTRFGVIVDVLDGDGKKLKPIEFTSLLETRLEEMISLFDPGFPFPASSFLATRSKNAKTFNQWDSVFEDDLKGIKIVTIDRQLLE